MSLEITGKVIYVGQLVEGQKKDGSGNWQKAEFAIETDEKYPKKVAFQAFGDKVPVVLALRGGQQVKVSFDPESREYEGKWYSQLNAWKIESGASQPQTSAPAQPEVYTAPNGDGSDLPF